MQAVLQKKEAKMEMEIEKEKRKTERDLELELGRDYTIDLRSNWFKAYFSLLLFQT